MRQSVFLLFLLMSEKICAGQRSVNCEDKLTCNECIEQLGCAWCINPIAQNGTNKETGHCFVEHSAQSKLCPKGSLMSPLSSLRTLEKLPLSSDSSNPVQISPQRIKVTARKNEKIRVDFQYQQSKNYPVDLYFLMDLSASMEPNKNTLGELGLKLAQGLLNLTNNVRLGFGSFVDKVDLPFASTEPRRLAHPCNDYTKKCARAYSYKNHLSLTHVHERFERMVKDAVVSGNLDRPEGGFDALMQVMVCKEEIGWRDQARRLIVFSTDVEYHVAGDGKLAGALEPNDATCHMENDQYREYLKYDYPSISHINYVAKQNNMNLIFALVKPKPDDNYRLEAYKNLCQEVENSHMGILEEDGTNVVNLVIDNYNRIVDSVTISTNATDDVAVKISPNQNVLNVHVGETVHFSATIQPLQCSNSNNKFIAIKPNGLKDTLIVELEVLCECPCSSSDHISYEENSIACTQGGNLKCGICSCRPGRFGDNCECDSSSFDTADSSHCRANNVSEICSGVGMCNCGKCICESRQDRSERIYGTYCECNNFSCRREGGEICSGKGDCDCGRCNCIVDWTGDACQCRDGNDTCLAPGTQEICSGHGECICGVCECYDYKRYSGKYCEECTSCQAKRCNELKDCVECQVYGTGIYSSQDCLDKCTGFKTEVLKKIVENEDDLVKVCQIPDNSSCTIIFEYWYNDDKSLVVRAEKEKVCPQPINYIVWIGCVIGSILLAGMVMLAIWRICTTYHDRRQYEKFEKEKAATKWHNNTNPLYRGATTTFHNPVYNRFSRHNTNS